MDDSKDIIEIQVFVNGQKAIKQCNASRGEYRIEKFAQYFSIDAFLPTVKGQLFEHETIQILYWNRC